MGPPAERVDRKEYHYRDGYESNGTIVKYQAESEWIRVHPQIEGDGLRTMLYDHMYKSDKTKEHRLKTVWIPDTVVFEHNFPRAWYSYDSKRKEILKLPGRLLDAQSIYDDFTHDVEEGGDIVAQFYHKEFHHQEDDHARPASARRNKSKSPRRQQSASMKDNGSKGGTSANNGKNHHHGKGHDKEEEEEQEAAIEYFTKETLFEFLHTRKVKPDGVLQKFVVPKGRTSSRCNFTIQAVWSPRVTRIYKRTNRYRIGDRSTPVENRAATFDGPPHFSAESLVAASTSGRIEQVCKAIVDHFAITEHKNVVRLVLYLKEDDKDRLWVLWASSLRCGGDKLNKVHVRVPVNFALKVHTEGAKKNNRSAAQPNMEHRLLDSDIALYEMTGDWLFARSRCADKGSHETNAASLGQGFNFRKGSSGGDGEGERRESTTKSRGGNDDSADNAETRNSDELAGTVVIAGNSPRRATNEAEESPPPKKVFLSPRAPFLALQQKPAPPCGPESPRHPLHEKYMRIKAEDDAKATAATAAETTGRRFRQRSMSYIPAPPKRLRDKTPMEILRADLKSLCADLVYEAYSASLQQGAAWSLKAVQVELPDLIQATLSPENMQDVVETLHLVAVEGSDGKLFEVKQGALGRGRRQDRPVAQLIQDINRYFDDLFATDEKTIEVRYRAYRDSLDVDDLEA